MATQPTIVAGVGQAGIKTLSEVREVVEEEADGERFKFIALDSDASQLKDAPDETTRFHLDPSPAYVNEDQRKYPYLTPAMEIDELGTRRRRPIGRYKLDHRGAGGFDDVYESLWTEISTHYERHATDLTSETTWLNVFLLHSFSGGTGSGAFPLVVSMLESIVEEVGETHDGLGYVGGVGFVSEPEFDPQETVVPGTVPTEYYPNTYAALRDLQTLISTHDRSEPLELPIWSRLLEGSDFEPEMFELETVPFDDYWLVGVDELRIGTGSSSHAGPESYREGLNRTVARAVHSISTLESAENWAPNTPFTGTFDQTEVLVPHDRVRSLVEAEEEREAKRERVRAEIPEAIEDREARRRELEDLKRNRNPDRDVGDDLRTEVREFLDENGFQDGATVIETRGLEELREVLAELEDRTIEARVLGIDTLHERLRAEDAAPAVRESYRETVQRLWNKYEIEDPEYGADRVESLEGKAEILETFLDDRIDEFTRIIDEWEPSFIMRLRDLAPPVTESLESDRERAEHWLAVLRDDYDALLEATAKREHLDELLGIIKDRRARARSEIDDRIADLDEDISALQNELEQLEDDITRLEDDIAGLRASLTTESTSDRVAVLPLEADMVDEIDRDTLENDLTSLVAYVEGGYVDEETFRLALETYQERAVAWQAEIVERDFEGTDDSRRFLDVDECWYRFHEANSDVLEHLPTAIPARVVTSGVAADLPSLSDPYRVECVSFSRRGPVSAFTTFQDYERLEDDGLLDEYATQYADYRQAFAYPEWYGRRYTDGFSPLSVPYPPEIELERVEKPDLETGALKNFVVSTGLDAYLWQGVHWEHYAPESEANTFEGWKDTLTNNDISFSDFQEATPDSQLKREWISGRRDWRDVVDAYSGTLTKQTQLRIEVEDEK